MTRKKTLANRNGLKETINPKIYILYSDTDGFTYANNLAQELSQHGNSVMLGSAQGSGSSSWASEIRYHLAHISFFIYIATPDTFKLDRTRSYLEYALARLNADIIAIAFREENSQPRIPPRVVDAPWLFENISALKKGPSDEVIAVILKLQKHYSSARPKIRYGAEFFSAPIPSRPLNEGKLILVGRGEVGKTSLVKRLTQNIFEHGELKTDGINITNWDSLVGKEKFTLNIWDFGGQEIMHATHQFFLTERSLYLVVLNGREGGEDIDVDYWLKHIESFGGDSPIIIVLNKVSQHAFELNYRGLQSKYPQIRAFVKTDCKDSVGITELRHEIEKAIQDMPEVKMDFPADWFRVKTHLESHSGEYMPFREFQRICYDEGVRDEESQNDLCWVLHCLGISLNYRDDIRLRETSVLKPEWVTQGIYKILNAPKLSARQGELHTHDLKTILPEERYPVDRHIFLLELMRKFSLCFAFPDEEDRYLIPELLGKEEPSETSEYIPRDCLNFEYHYGILPEGLIPKFIVRSHVLSQGQARWRTGVILRYEDCKALVFGNLAEHRITIRIKGVDLEARRRLLALIRYDLTKINAEFKDKLDVKVKVPLVDHPNFSVDYAKLVAFEKNGVLEFPEFVGSSVVTVKVKDLLNGVDLEMQREEALSPITNARTLFFSYSHKDEALRDELEVHLKLLQRQGVISTWHDRKIMPGTEWDGEIDKRLERASIILLLVSVDFLASDYCWENEVKYAMEKHESGTAIVIPIFLRPCDWTNAPFAKLQGLPKDAKPITTWSDRDIVWTEVAKKIRELIADTDTKSTQRE